MAASCNNAAAAEQRSLSTTQSTPPLKTPKTEAPSPEESEDLSDSNHHYHSNASTPNRFSPLLNVSGAAAGGGRSGLLAAASASSSTNSYTTTACRGMSWTPSETNALIAVWGNERLTEARMQQLEVAGTVFSGKAPGPAMYERTLRRCYSRVKEHGIGKRKSSYSLEQLEKVFGQGGWDAQGGGCAPVLINSSGLYQDMESDSSVLEDFSQEDWCNQVLASAFQEGDMEAEETQVPKNRVIHFQAEVSEKTQKRESMRNVVRILESVQLKWEHFQTWTEFSRLHLSNKLAIFGVGYNTRWREDVHYHHAEISSQVPLGKRLREYFNPEKPEGRVVMTKVQKMNWKNVYYKFLDITISEARCLELHMEVDWIHVAQTRPAGSAAGLCQYLLPGDIPKTYGLYAVGHQGADTHAAAAAADSSAPRPGNHRAAEDTEPGGLGGLEERTREPGITYCYLGISEDRTLQQSLLYHFQGAGKQFLHGEASGITRFLQENCRGGGGGAGGRQGWRWRRRQRGRLVSSDGGLHQYNKKGTF
ncbi:hypothetical protein NHX12_009612 [Muraenolepis orangiensis]|uniref:Myb/SANT-like DNA-binding domain-containing protein 2 n=1 Tax=Muraenolepis orangiensis TaxID=630683 RepID=A0A9Q0DHY4_9TELE|nr:hypothetical protein NHX12_009612 [Muraenolepis orangiensis]